MVSSWLVPTVKRPFKGIPTFCTSCLIQGGLIFYLAASCYARRDELNPCNSEAIAQLFAIYVFVQALFSSHSSGTVLQICMYSTWLKVDGEPAPDAMGLMRFQPDTIKPVRPTTSRMRWKLAAVPLADIFIENWNSSQSFIFKASQYL